MSAIDAATAERRALFLFERLTNDAGARARLTAHEPAEVISALERLERAAPRSRQAFPTEEDLAERRIVMPVPEGVGSYRFTGLLGEGGMGIVFAAERNDGLFEHRVAIKLIHPDRSSRAALARFDRERRLLARLDHPNIARLIDGGVTADGWPYIIMERVDGGPIDGHCRDNLITARGRVALLIAIGAALRAAHNALVVHGDIKPDNILIHRDGQPRLLDFGVARLADSDGVSAFEPRTLAFAAPERRDGDGPTIASDVYAMGVLLRCLLGRGDADRPAAMSIADRDLAAIAAKATATRAADRHGGADAFITDLERWMAGLPVSARPHTVGYVAGRFIARHRLPVSLAGAALVALLSMLLFALQGWHEARSRATDLRDLTRYQLVDLDRRLDTLPRTVALRVALAAEAQSYLDRLARQPDSPPALRIDAADGFRRLAALQGAADRPSLGDAAAARASFARARALIDGERDAAALDLRSRLLIDQARMEVANANVATAKRLEQRAAAGPTPPALRPELFLLQSEIAQWDGAFVAAATLAARGRAALGRRTDGPAHALLTARAFDLEAEANYYAGRRDAALAGYRAALLTLAEAARRWPGNRALQWSLTKARWALGSTALDAGDPAAALALLDAAYRGSAAEAAADPADHVAGRRRRLMMLSLGQGLIAAGRTDAGLARIERSVAERRIEWQRYAGDEGRSRDWLVGVAALGDALVALRRIDDACRVYGRAAIIVGRLVAADRLTRLDRASTAALLDAQRARNCPAAAALR